LLLFRFLIPASLRERLGEAFWEGIREGFPDVSWKLRLEFVAPIVEVLPASHHKGALLRTLGDLVEAFEPGALDDVGALGLVISEEPRQADVRRLVIDFDHAGTNRWYECGSESPRRPP